ncbi:hypothetical protein ABIE65_000356 [Constrictibacter sp. MBR-5]|jgi:hypothetical protein|uniref:hypothetical protein n=1 Tax=Constrictibacter sp. MBR-5 TaxID=3156467 RepID=UPI003395DE03
MNDIRESYRLFGLRISSDIRLPELQPFSADEPGDVEIRRGPVPADGTEVGPKMGPFSHAAENALWLRVPGVARYLIRDGGKLIYQPEGDIDEDSVRVFMLGTCIGALLAQRGHLVLHGNVFEVGGGCAVCVGSSGAGKSTLAARMLQRGHRIIADDVCPVDLNGRAIPGISRLKLWQDTARRLEIDTAALRRIRPNIAKFEMPLGDAFRAEPAPIRAIYVLTPWNQDRFTIADMSGIAKFQALRANSYRFRFLKGMQLGPRHFRQCRTLAADVPVAQVFRPRLGFDIDGLVDLILADLAGRGAVS